MHCTSGASLSEQHNYMQSLILNFHYHYMYISIMHMLICMVSLVHSRLIIGLCYWFIISKDCRPVTTMHEIV